jgi:hypothetical protein
MALTTHAQLHETVHDGIRIQARAIYCSGDTRDLDCTLSVLLAGDKLADGIRLSPARRVRVVDDTGASLVRTNRTRVFGGELLPSRTEAPDFMRLGRPPAVFQMPIYFKKPEAKAKLLRLVEWETELESSNGTLRVLRFQIENIRLPWMDPPRLQAAATFVQQEVAGPEFTQYRIRLTLAGGPVPGSAGLRTLRVHRAETEDGRPVTISRPKYTQPEDFSPKLDWAGQGRIVQRDIIITAPSDAGSVSILSADADLYFPAPSNGGRVEFNSFEGMAGRFLESPSFASNGIQVIFLGRESFESRRQRESTNRIRAITMLPSPPLPEDAPDSLMFSVTDPQLRTLAFSFHDGTGKPIPVLTRMIETAPFSSRSNGWYLYAFKSSPPPDIRVTISVVTPESLERVPFTVEKIALR